MSLRKRAAKFSRGQWEVQRERFHLPDPEPPPVEGSAERPVAGLLPNILRSMGLSQAYWMQQLVEEWAVLMGPQVASQTRPGRLDGSTLTIYVSSSIWLSELHRYSQAQMLKNIQDRFGAERIRYLRLHLDPEPPKA